MSELQNFADTKKQRAIIRAYLFIVMLSCMLTIWAFIRIPTEAGNAFLWGLSKSRIFLTGSIFLVIFAAAWILFKSWFNRPWFQSFTNKLVAKLNNDHIWGSIILLSIIGIISGSNFLFQHIEITEPYTYSYYERLQPLILWVVILCIQNLICLPFLRYGFSFSQFKSRYRFVFLVFLIFGLLLFFWAWILQTGNGVTRTIDDVGWFQLGTPLMENQIFLAWGITMGFLFAWTWLAENPGKLRWARILEKEIVIYILLWIVAFAVWMFIPMEPNWFASAPRPPNFEYYPNSDASVYDITAQNALIGEGFKSRGSPFTYRPMYALFLALLHSIGGKAYEPIIWMQLALLALLPVFIYGLTKLICNRTAGLLAALLIIIREGNAIALGTPISEAHAKLLMPFLPTAFGAILTVLLIVAWLKHPQKRQLLTLVTGGVIGVFMLIRPEFGVLIPFLGLAALLQLIHHPKVWLKGMALVAVGLVLMLGPWIWRNYQLTGTIFLDQPNYRVNLFAQRYREDPVGFLGRAPQPTPLEASVVPTPPPTKENAGNPEETSDERIQRLTDGVIEFAKENSDSVLSSMRNHFFNSSIQTVLLLPSAYRFTESAIHLSGTKSLDQFWYECCSLDSYTLKLPFWRQWDGEFSNHSITPILVTLFVISFGIGTAWKQQRFIGLVPLFGAFGYYLINAFALNSGGRYILPFDWIGILYFSIGLAGLSIWGISYFKDISQSPEVVTISSPGAKENSPALFSGKNLGVAALIFAIGCTLPFVEKIIPSQFSDGDIEARTSLLLDQALSEIPEEQVQFLEKFVSGGGDILLGQALYPRYNKAHETGSVWDAYQPRPYEHIDFYLSSPQDAGVVLPVTNAPDYFPNAATVIVFGCRQGRSVDASAVILFSNSGEFEKIILRSPIPDNLSCPFPPLQ